MTQHNQSNFAKLASVSRNAIMKAIKSGKLVKLGNRKIDDSHPLSMKYLRTQLEKSKKSTITEKVKLKVQAKKSKKPNKKIDKKPSKKAEKKSLPSGSEGGKRSISKKPTKSQKRTTPDNLDFDSLEDEATQQYIDKEEIDIEYKRANTEKIKIMNAEKLRLLVPVEFVAKKFGKLSAVIINYFFPMGGRLAPIICGVCKVTDPKTIKKVEVILNNEITRALSEFKKASAEEVDG